MSASSSTTDQPSGATNDRQNKVSSFTSAWQSLDQILHQRLAPPRVLYSPEMLGCTVLGLCLSPIPIASKKLYEEQPSPSATTHGDGKKRPIRITFAVLKVLNAGWGFGETIVMPPSGSGGGKKSKGPTKKKDPLTTLIGNAGDLSGQHALMHSWEVLANYQRGEKADEYMVVSPGMVFELKVWDTKIPIVFKGQSTDALPFDLALIQLTTKSMQVKEKESKLEIRSFALLPELSSASRSILPSVNPYVVFPSVYQATAMHMLHHNATHLQLPISPDGVSLLIPGDTGAPSDNGENANEDGDEEASAAARPKPPPAIVLPPGLSQESLKLNLATTMSMVRVVPTSGVFSVGPDDRFYFRTEGALVDLPCTTLLVRYESKQFPVQSFSVPTAVPSTPASNGENNNNTEGAEGGATDTNAPSSAVTANEFIPDPWTVKLLNVALTVGAVELFIAVDTYRNKKETVEHTLDAFARIDITPFLRIFNNTVPVSPPPPLVLAAFESQGMSAAIKHLMVYPLITASTTHFMALDARKLTRRPPAAQSPLTPTSEDSPLDPKRKKSAPSVPSFLGPFLQPSAAWEQGHNLYVFIEGRLVFHCIVPVQLPGTASSGDRGMEAISILKPEDLGAIYDEDENENSGAAPAPSATAAAAASGNGKPAPAANATKKQSNGNAAPAAANSNGAKRRRDE